MLLECWFAVRALLPFSVPHVSNPLGHLSVFGDILGCYTTWGEGAVGI